MSKRRWTRRQFLGATAGCGAVLASAGPLAAGRWLGEAVATPAPPAAGSLVDLIRTAPRARYWVSPATATTRDDCLACHAASELPAEATHPHATRSVRCRLCAQNCLIGPGQRGRCRARMNVDGELKSLVYGRPVSVHVDPIEKKPFYHFLPGKNALSFSTAGCPLSCKFCQNWEISQAKPEDFRPRYVAPDEIVRAAVGREAPIVAFTYNEPTVFTEYLCDVAVAARKRRLRSVLVSCGFMNGAPLSEMCGVLDAVKIDLKGFSPDFYRDVCSAELAPVLRSIEQVAAAGVHLELVNLVVPTLNDSPRMLSELAAWVVGKLGPDVPVHFTRFHPDYQLRHLPPTPVATLERAREIALTAGMRYAYVGNVPGHPGNNTYCPGCHRVVIERQGFFVKSMTLEDGRCPECKTPVAGVWS